MNLYLRLIKVLLGIFLNRRRSFQVFDTSVLLFRVWPNDLDANGHMNNGRYLTVMDLGRVDLMSRAGLLPTIIKKRWVPVIGTVQIVFRKSLHAFQKYELRTRVLGWDEKWVYMEQRFVAGEICYAAAIVKGLMRTKDGKVPSQTLVDMVSPGVKSPSFEGVLARWAREDKEFFNWAFPGE